MSMYFASALLGREGGVGMDRGLFTLIRSGGFQLSGKVCSSELSFLLLTTAYLFRGLMKQGSKQTIFIEASGDVGFYFSL